MAKYPFVEIEPKWQKYWDEKKTFRAVEDPSFPKDKRRYVLDMFPYPSGIFIQNMGTMPTYTSHDSTGFFAVAAILVGGASAKRASISNIFIGVLLLHFLFYVTPLAANTLTGNAGLGEYFRQFIGYGVIAFSLVLYAWREKNDTNRERAGLRGGAAQASVQGGAK